MNKKQFNERLANFIKVKEANDGEMESVKDWFGTPVPNAIIYAVHCNNVLTKILYDNSGYEAQFAFTTLISKAEWEGGRDEVLKTVTKAAKTHADDEKAMAELIYCVNMKSWEHYERKHRQWAIFYSELYYAVKDLVYDYYENEKDKTYYVWKFLD